MKKISFVIVFLVTLLCAELGVGAFTKTVIRHAPETQYNLSNTIQTLFHRKSDILILGASRAHHSYDPRIIEEKTGFTCFNGGRSGVKMDYFDLCVEAYLARCTPKIIIIDISSDMMEATTGDRFKDVKCLYGLCDPLTQAMDSACSPLERIKLHSYLYRNNRIFNEVLQLCLSERRADLLGFQPLADHHYRSPYTLSTVPFGLDSNMLSCLDHIAAMCHSHHVQLIIAYAPTLRITTHGCSQWLANYCKDRRIPYYDYSWAKKYYLHPELFRDEVHVNEKGAGIFTDEFCGVINAHLAGEGR